MKALVLCAGKGERLRPFTNTLAKPAIPFLNIPMLYYNLWYLRNFGIKEFIINTHHLPHTVQWAADHYPDKSIRFYIEHEPNLLGSAGPLAKNKALLGVENNFILANGDTVFFLHHEKVLQDFLKFHQDNKADATILVIRHTENTKNFGSVWIDSKNRVRGFGKSSSANETDPMHFVGLILMSRECLQWCEEKESNIFYDVFTKHLTNKKIMAYLSSDISWYETGNINDYWSAMSQVHSLLFSKSQGSSQAFIQKNFYKMFSDFFPGSKFLDKLQKEQPKDMSELLAANKNLVK